MRSKVRPNVWLCLLGLTLVATPVQAEIVPRAIHGSLGMMALNTYSENYQPTTMNVAVSSFGLDAAVSGRWSVALNAMMTADETMAGYGIGSRYHFVQRRIVTTGGKNGYIQHTTTSVPRWHFDIGTTLSRYRVNQSLSTNDPFTISALRQVPVKADLYGVAITPAVSLAFDERWALETQYSYCYGTATGFNIVGHAMTMGINFSF